MIDREDMIALIKAYESILNIISVVTDLTGGYTMRMMIPCRLYLMLLILQQKRSIN